MIRYSVKPCSWPGRGGWDVRSETGRILRCTSHRVDALNYANRAVRRARLQRMHDSIKKVRDLCIELGIFER